MARNVTARNVMARKGAPRVQEIRKTAVGNAWRMIRGKQRYEIEVLFEKEFANTASETRWHPTQQEQWGDDGRVTLTFSIDGLDEIVWWVLGYGPGATVIGPPELRKRVHSLASETVRRYSKKK